MTQSTNIGQLDLEQAATLAAGNWRSFQCFAWFRQSDLRDANQWAVIYTHHRDSGLLDQSNASVIQRAMQPFTEGDDPDVVQEGHSHWAVGQIHGFSVRVFKQGSITEAFETYHELAQQMDDYPILDESDYSDREYEATIQNIKDAAWRLKNDFDLPEGWQYQVYDWLSENRSGDIERSDDQGGYPSEAALTDAFHSIGFEPSTATT